MQTETLSPAAVEILALACRQAPYLATLTRKLSVADHLLYRRGNFNGSFDDQTRSCRKF